MYLENGRCLIPLRSAYGLIAAFDTNACADLTVYRDFYWSIRHCTTCFIHFLDLILNFWTGLIIIDNYSYEFWSFVEIYGDVYRFWKSAYEIVLLPFNSKRQFDTFWVIFVVRWQYSRAPSLFVLTAISPIFCGNVTVMHLCVIYGHLEVLARRSYAFWIFSFRYRKKSGSNRPCRRDITGTTECGCSHSSSLSCLFHCSFPFFLLPVFLLGPLIFRYIIRVMYLPVLTGWYL